MGGLAGYNEGTIAGVQEEGSVSAERVDDSGSAAVGLVVGSLSGSVIASYATGSATGNYNSEVGGLVGSIGSDDDGTVTASYSSASVNGAGTTTGITLGGLVGDNKPAIGNPVGTVTDSYWDKETSGQTTSAASSDSAGKTTKQLQTPVGYTSIYANWNVDIDGDSAADSPWIFGSPSDYPVLATEAGSSLSISGPTGDVAEGATAQFTVTLSKAVGEEGYFPPCLLR